MPTPPVTRLGACLATLAAALLGACADTATTAPAASAPHFAKSTARGARGRSRLVANRVKYRDTGAKPSKAREGSTAVESRALLAKDGRTTVELTTGVLDSAATAPGAIAKLQLRYHTRGGRVLDVDNFNKPSETGYVAVAEPGLPRRGLVEVRAHVKGAGKGNGTDIVTALDTVKLRPDLRVALHAPAHAAALTTVNISATVRELNGDLGARANCVLSVDGAEVDRAAGIWVANGGVVKCRFVHKFTSVGTKQVRVDVRDVAPADYDASNNAASGTIRVDPFPTTMVYEASAGSYASSSTYYRSSVNHWPSGLIDSVTTIDTTFSSRSQSAELHAETPFGLPFGAVTARLAVRSGGNTYDSLSIPSLVDYINAEPTDGSYRFGWTSDDVSGAADGYGCMYDYSRAGAASFTVCSDWTADVDSLGRHGGLTTVDYEFDGGSEAIYVSRRFQGSYNAATGESTADGYIDVGAANGFVPFGQDVAIGVTLGWANLYTFAATPVVALSTLEPFDEVTPKYCETTVVPWVTVDNCYASSGKGLSRTGAVSTFPDALNAM